MKRPIITVLLGACVLVEAGSAGTPVNPKDVSTTIGDYRQGRQYFPEAEFDFGYVPQNAFVAHNFWLINKGGDTLEIIQIKPG